MSAVQGVAEAATRRPTSNAACELLDTVGLTQFANQRADALSGGQRQRVGIARAVMQQPGAAARGRADVLARSEDLGRDHGAAGRRSPRARGIPVILNIHNVPLAKRFATHVVGMTGGRVVYDGAAGGLTDEHLKQIYGGEDWLE